MVYRPTGEARRNPIFDAMMKYASEHPGRCFIVEPKNVVSEQPDRFSAILEGIDTFERMSEDYARHIMISSSRA